MRHQIVSGIAGIVISLVLFSTLSHPAVYAQTAPEPLPRSTEDRPDDSPNYQVHIVYVVPGDGADENLDTNGAINTSVASFQKWLLEQSGGQKLRMDTYEGSLDVTFVRLTSDDASMAAEGAYIRDRIEAELAAAGFDDERKLYAVYYGGTANDTCGGGAWPPDLVGRVGAIYLKGVFADPNIPSCGSNPLALTEDEPGYFDFSMLHEIVHTLGFVATCAPNQTHRGHVSDDPRDLMYAGDEPWNPQFLDTGRDDYYGHNNEDCPDLAKSAFMEPPTITTFLPPDAEGIAAQATLEVDTGACSQKADQKVDVTFTNKTNESVDLFWVDYNCQEQPFGTLEPDKSLVFSTFVTHPWHLRAADGTLLAETIPVSAEAYTFTLRP